MWLARSFRGALRLAFATMALAAFGGAAWAQAAPGVSFREDAARPAPRTQPTPHGLVFYVAAARGVAPTVSLGIAQRTPAGMSLQGRREMQADCTWSEAGDMQVDADAVVPLRDPVSLGGAEQFGDYYATLFNALSTAGGAVTSPAQFACVRRTMTTLGESLMRRAAQAASEPHAAPLPPRR